MEKDIDWTTKDVNKLIISDLWMETRIHENNIFMFSKCDDEPSQILFRDSALGIYGGAELFKRNVADLPKNIREALLCISSETEEVLVGFPFFRLTRNHHSSLMDSFDCFRKKFYHSLFLALSEFVFEMPGNSFICIQAGAEEYAQMMESMSWPYIIKVTPSHSSDNTFYGILNLKAKNPKLEDL